MTYYIDEDDIVGISDDVVDDHTAVVKAMQWGKVGIADVGDDVGRPNLQ